MSDIFSNPIAIVALRKDLCNAITEAIKKYAKSKAELTAHVEKLRWYEASCEAARMSLILQQIHSVEAVMKTTETYLKNCEAK